MANPQVMFFCSCISLCYNGYFCLNCELYRQPITIVFWKLCHFKDLFLPYQITCLWLSTNALVVLYACFNGCYCHTHPLPYFHLRQKHREHIIMYLFMPCVTTESQLALMTQQVLAFSLPVTFSCPVLNGFQALNIS